ncbi:hypothetical protein AMTRI_Chr09g16290 [Amborella trichopoda]
MEKAEKCLYEGPPVVSLEELISMLKDDGDFDRLRHKIIQTLKTNESLKNNIASAVRESSVLNSEGSENMKPRQLFDTIYQEIKNQAMDQISHAVWEAMRFPDGMGKEISETVEGVFGKLVEQKTKLPKDMSVPSNKQEPKISPAIITSASESVTVPCNYNEPKETLGFSQPDDLCNKLGGNSQEPEPESESEPRGRPNEMQLIDSEQSESPGFLRFADQNQQQIDGDHDMDPDVPPGFG